MTHISQPLPRFSNSYPAPKPRWTTHGERLAEENPEVIASFQKMVPKFADGAQPAHGTFEWIGRGDWGHVYGLPGHADTCVKIVSPRTIHGHSEPKPNDFSPYLALEAKFMNRIGQRLARRPEHGVRAPIQYGTLAFAGGAALLQERVPATFVTIEKLASEERKRGILDISDGLLEQSEIARRRVLAALGFSTLRLGAQDLHGTYGKANFGNILVDREKRAAGDIYVLDLVGPGLPARAVARVVSRLPSRPQ